MFQVYHLIIMIISNAKFYISVAGVRWLDFKVKSIMLMRIHHLRSIHQLSVRNKKSKLDFWRWKIFDFKYWETYKVPVIDLDLLCHKKSSENKFWIYYLMCSYNLISFLQNFGKFSTYRFWYLIRAFFGVQPSKSLLSFRFF